MKMKMAQEKNREQTVSKKIGVAFAALLSLIYSGLLTYYFYTEQTAAAELEKDGKYTCIYEEKMTGVQKTSTDIAPMWLNWMTTAFICYAILSAIAIFAIIGAFLPALRIVAGCCVCCAQIFALVVTIGLTIVRLSDQGEFCVSKAGELLPNGNERVSIEFKDDGEFLKKAITFMWCLGCLHCCCLSIGLAPI